MKRLGWIVIGLLVLGIGGLLIWVPKPMLLTYERYNVVSTSVYWRGFGESGQLLDSQASIVTLDQYTQHLHICYDPDKVISCQYFRVIETQGPLAALQHFWTQ